MGYTKHIVVYSVSQYSYGLVGMPIDSEKKEGHVSGYCISRIHCSLLIHWFCVITDLTLINIACSWSKCQYLTYQEMISHNLNQKWLVYRRTCVSRPNKLNQWKINMDFGGNHQMGHNTEAITMFFTKIVLLWDFYMYSTKHKKS